MKQHFNDLKAIFNSIIDKKFDKIYASRLVSAYIFDEDENIEFDDRLNKFAFLFNFFISETDEMSDEEFKKLILNLANINSSSPTPIDIKRVLYEKELEEIKNKLDKGLISEDVYSGQINKFLD